MIEGMASITTAALGLALDAAALRQQAIAANVANAGLADYVPVRMNFAEHLEQMRAAMSAPDGARAIRAMGAQLRLEPELDAQGQAAKVQVDVEMASMAQNNVLYQALIKGLNRHFSIQTLAANDGKR